jgi:RNA recognition motif-containing protein
MGLSLRADLVEIRRYFETFGVVKSVWMTRDDVGNFRGVCFVNYSAEDEVLRALNSKSHQLHGKPFVVERARQVAPVRTPRRKRCFSIFTERTFLFQLSMSSIIRSCHSMKNFISEFEDYGHCKIKVLDAVKITNAEELSIVKFSITGEHSRLYEVQGRIQRRFGAISFRAPRENQD